MCLYTYGVLECAVLAFMYRVLEYEWWVGIIFVYIVSWDTGGVLEYVYLVGILVVSIYVSCIDI